MAKEGRMKNKKEEDKRGTKNGTPQKDRERRTGGQKTTFL